MHGTITHGEARDLAPPGAFVWRVLTAGAWAGRLPPFSEHSRSWHRYTERGALCEVLRLLWSEHADVQGIPG